MDFSRKGKKAAVIKFFVVQSYFGTQRLPLRKGRNILVLHGRRVCIQIGRDDQGHRCTKRRPFESRTCLRTWSKVCTWLCCLRVILKKKNNNYMVLLISMHTATLIAWLTNCIV